MGSKRPEKPPVGSSSSKPVLPPPPPPRKYTGPFMEVARIGYCANGKARGYVEFSGKRTIERDRSRPLSCLIVPLIKDLLSIIFYKDADELAEDVALLKNFLDRLEIEKDEC